MPLPHLTSWRSLPSEGGGTLALEDEWLAVASAARLCIWRGHTQLATVEAHSPAPGMPRFGSQCVYWGPGFLDLVSGHYTLFAAAQPALWPGGGERPHLYAWSPAGGRLLGSFSTSQPRAATRLTLFGGDTGEPLASLPSEPGLPPQAAWLGPRTIVVGSSSPRIFDYAGEPRGTIALDAGTLVAMEGTFDERRLLAVDLNQTLAWIDLSTRTVLDRWDGPWTHGAVSPDGQWAAALEFPGKLHWARLRGDRFEPLGHVAVAPEAVAVVLTHDRLATVGGGKVRLAHFTPDGG